MITTKHSVFLHNPKTGGTWLKHVLDPLIVEYTEHHVPDGPFSHLNTFVFVRNPWSWYVSLYLFLKNGSEHYPNQLKPPIMQALSDDKGFDNFIKYATSPDEFFKKKVLNIYKIFALDNPELVSKPEEIILIEWLNSDKSYHNVIHDVYTRYAHTVGKYENLHQDLIQMLAQSGELTEELSHSIVNTLPINVTADKDDYRVYYNDQTRQMVADTSNELIKRYGYEF